MSNSTYKNVSHKNLHHSLGFRNKQNSNTYQNFLDIGGIKENKDRKRKNSIN